MRIACLVTVCAALTSTLCSATVSSVTRYPTKEYRVAVEPSNSSLTSDVSHHPDDFLFLRDIPSRRSRRSHHVQVFPTRQYSSRGLTRARARRQLRKLSTRSLPISRSLDVSHNHNQIESIQAPESFEDGAVHIEPLYRVSKKKGIWDSLIDILHRVVTPSKGHLGPLVGPLHVPGLGDKVYIRLLEPPESNHLVIKVVTHVPHEIEAPPHPPSLTTVVKSAEPISSDHHASLLSTDVAAESPGHLQQVHPTSVDLSPDGLSVLSNHHSGHPGSPPPDFFSSPSNQYRQVHQPAGLFSGDSHASSSNQHQQVHQTKHHSGSHHSDNAPSSSNHHYRHVRPTSQSKGPVHTSSKTVMKIPMSMPSTYKPPKELIRTSRMFKGKQKPNHNPPSPTTQTLSSTSISPTKKGNHQHNVRMEENRQLPTSTKPTIISSPRPSQPPRTENREPIFHGVHFENSDFKPFYSEQYDPSVLHYNYKPPPTIEMQEFSHKDVLRPKTTQATVSLNPIFADIPSSPVTRVSRVVAVESSTPSHVGSGQAFEIVRAPTLMPTYAPFIPHPPFILPHETLEMAPTQFNLFTPMDEPRPKSHSEKPIKSKEVKSTWSSPHGSSRVSASQNRSNSSWESVKMKHVDQRKPEIRVGKVISDVTPMPKKFKAVESFVTLASISPSIPPTINGPTVVPSSNPVSKGPTIVPVSKGPTILPVSKGPTILPMSKGPTLLPMTNVVNSSQFTPLASPVPKVPPRSELPSAKRSEGKDDTKCLKCQHSREKKVPAVTENPRPVDSIFHEQVPSLTMGNSTPAAKVSSSSSSGTKSTSSATTVKPVLISSTTKKPMRLSSGSLSQKTMSNNSLKKEVTSSPTRKPGVLANTMKKSPVSSNSSNNSSTTKKPRLFASTTKKSSGSSSSSSSSSSTTRKPLMAGSDFKKRIEMWKKNRKV